MKFSFIKLFIISIVVSGCSGLQVKIETPQPEDDFVVVCSWSSSFLKLHGGASRIKENVFVASSGEIINCGTSWRGDGPSVVVSHPLYRSGEYKMENGMQIVLPKLKEQYLEELMNKYEGRTLVNGVRDYLAGNFPGRYLSHYQSVKKVNTAHFKQAYEERLTQLWEKMRPIIQDSYSNKDIRNYKVEDFVNSYWKLTKSYEDWEEK